VRDAKACAALRQHLRVKEHVARIGFHAAAKQLKQGGFAAAAFAYNGRLSFPLGIKMVMLFTPVDLSPKKFLVMDMVSRISSALINISRVF
jgi:hypothetical protein